MSTTADCRSIYGLTLFEHIAEAGKAEIAARFERLAIERRRTLVEEGEPSDSMYVVLSGRFSVTRRDHPDPINEIGAGQPIGEIGFLTGSARTATVTAMRDSIVLKLDRQRFEALAESHPRIWRSMSANLAERLAVTTSAPARPVPPRPRTIAVIPAGGSALDDAFIERLTTAFSAQAPTIVIDSSRQDILVSSGAALEGSELTERLNALETDYTFVLMIADATATGWTSKIIRHADLVLAAGYHIADPTPNATEVVAAQFVAPAARRLVLIHETRRSLSGTHRWLLSRSLAMHHHVALDEREDFARLVRFIAGTARGLVLAGGGALCATHVGLYKALVEARYRFDMMGGTSGGSAMAAAFLLGSTPEEIDRGVHQMFVQKRAMHRYTLPRYSLLDHAHFDRELKSLYGGFDIEDLWLPFFAVSTNLSRYGLHVHRSGPLWKAVRASASIPVMLPPVYTELGEMLVDGSLVDNVPVETMHQLKTGPNVVVAFGASDVERFDVAYNELPSRAAIIRLSMTPWRRRQLPDAPGLSTVLMRSLMANRHAFHENLGPHDLLLVPPISPQIGFLDWHRHGELFSEGYQWGRARLQDPNTATVSSIVFS